MYRTTSKRSVLAGLVSHGLECGRGGGGTQEYLMYSEGTQYGVYTRITAMKGWILDTIKTYDTLLIREGKDVNHFCNMY